MVTQPTRPKMWDYTYQEMGRVLIHFLQTSANANDNSSVCPEPNTFLLQFRLSMCHRKLSTLFFLELCNHAGPFDPVSYIKLSACPLWLLQDYCSSSWQQCAMLPQIYISVYEQYSHLYTRHLNAISNHITHQCDPCL